MQERSALEQIASILDLADDLIVQLLKQKQHNIQSIAFHALSYVQVASLACLNKAT